MITSIEASCLWKMGIPDQTHLNILSAQLIHSIELQSILKSKNTLDYIYNSIIELTKRYASTCISISDQMLMLG